MMAWHLLHFDSLQNTPRGASRALTLICSPVSDGYAGTCTIAGSTISRMTPTYVPLV